MRQRLNPIGSPGGTPQPIVFWGATGQAKVLRELTSHLGYQLVAVFDNNPEVLSPFADVPLFHGREGFEEWWQSFGARSAAFLIAIGGASGRDRLRLQRSLEERGLTPITAVHPAAFVAADASIGQGSQILMRAIVGVAARLGAACIVNTAASVDHESRLGDGVHIAPGATLAGCVEVGDFSMIGTGAVLLPRIRVGRDVIVGAGAVVTRDLPDGVVAYGNPARIVRANCPQARC